MQSTNEPETLIDRILARLDEEPSRLAAKILSAQGAAAFSRRELRQAIESHAAHLHDAGVARGATVIVLAEHGPELVLSFLAALRLGAVPTIYAPPTPKTPAAHYERTLLTLAAASGATHVVTNVAAHPALVRLASSRPELRIVAPEPRGGAAGARPRVSAGPDDVAFLQYSSGTTGLRKGIALTNRAVLAQLDRYAQRIALRDDDVIVSWLPLYHDMGLVACFLLPLACGVPFVMMSAFDWLARPARVLEAMHEEGGTLAWLPNFAFNVLARRVDPQHLDLSRVRGIVNCSEPVRADSLRAFSERFRGAGLRDDALWTCYAMAETTFAVTQGGCGEPVVYEELDAHAFARGRAEPAAPGAARRTVVSSGRPLLGTTVRIVDAARVPLDERAVGEIAVRSESAFAGYLGQRELTREVLADGWYFTGDVGYVANGHVFVTGRSKDRIIVAGKNIHPEDIEEVVSTVPGVIAGRVAAFGVASERLGTEEVVVLAEAHARAPEEVAALVLAIAAAVGVQLECTPSDVRVLAPGTLRKSTSGKIARSSNRERYVEDWRSRAL